MAGHPTQRSTAQEHTVDLSIIIPAYNEARRIVTTVRKQMEELRGWSYQIVLCDDGSSDNTFTLCESMKEQFAPNLFVLKQKHAGRGAALKFALGACISEYVAFSSADIVLRRFELERAFYELRSSDLVMFSKWTGKRSNFLRWFLGRVLSFSLRVFFGIPFYDTQGVKLARLRTARKIISACRSSGFFFDAEVAIVAFRRGMRVVEQPWDYSYSPSSTVTVFAVLRMVQEMLSMRL